MFSILAKGYFLAPFPLFYISNFYQQIIFSSILPFLHCILRIFKQRWIDEGSLIHKETKVIEGTPQGKGVDFPYVSKIHDEKEGEKTMSIRTKMMWEGWEKEYAREVDEEERSLAARFSLCVALRWGTEITLSMVKSLTIKTKITLSKPKCTTSSTAPHIVATFLLPNKAKATSYIITNTSTPW